MAADQGRLEVQRVLAATTAHEALGVAADSSFEQARHAFKRVSMRMRMGASAFSVQHRLAIDRTTILCTFEAPMT